MGLGMLTAVVNCRFLSDFGTHGPGMAGHVNALSGLGAIASPLLLLVAGGRLEPLFWNIGAVAALTIALAPAGRSLPTGPWPARPSPGPHPDPRLWPLWHYHRERADRLRGLGAR
jgi:hypothetical protein